MLEVEFSSGSLVSYMDVPIEVYRMLLTSDSAGKFFSEHIRGKFTIAIGDEPKVKRGKRRGRSGPGSPPSPPPSPEPGHLNPWYDPHGTRRRQPPPGGFPTTRLSRG
jgi:KTSC domain